MSIYIKERRGSGETRANPPQVTLRYVVNGTVNRAVANALAVGNTPLTLNSEYGLLHRHDVHLQPVGHRTWYADVPYGAGARIAGGARFSFDTSGGTVRIKHSRETVSSYKAAGEESDPPDHKGAIGVVEEDNDRRVEGVEIVMPALRFTISFRHAQGEMDILRAKALAGVTATVNSDSWFTFSPGELLFLGATGGDGSEAEAEVAYSFAAAANKEGLSFGDIADVELKGHHVLWISYTDDVDSEQQVKRARYAYVERVYEELPFGTALGFGGE